MPDLTHSLRGWSAARRRIALAICIPISLAIAILGGIQLGGIFLQSDSTYYLNLAAGRPAILPFASRQLAPLLVRTFTHITGASIRTGFTLLGLLSILVFLLTVLGLLLRSGAPRFLLAAIAGLFFWAQQFNTLVMPDLFYAALMCAFLLLLRAQRFYLAGLMMFPLVIARESTLLTLVCLLVAGYRILRWREALTAVLALAAGILVVRHLTANALPNAENISPTLYLLAKMPWNFLKNFLGVDLWANVYTSCGVPRFTLQLHLGPLRQLGVCRWQWRYPVLLFNSALVSFGLLPLLLVKSRRTALPLLQSRCRQHLLLRFSILYGAISFLLAGMLGESFPRLFAYSWPIFLVALPLLLGAAGATFGNPRAALLFLFAHLLVSWCGLNIYIFWIGLVLLAIDLFAWSLLARHWRPGDDAVFASPPA